MRLWRGWGCVCGASQLELARAESGSGSGAGASTAADHRDESLETATIKALKSKVHTRAAFRTIRLVAPLIRGCVVCVCVCARALCVCCVPCASRAVCLGA
jgi:hypothetical protein